MLLLQAEVQVSIVHVIINQGLGLAIAKRFAKMGANVTIIARNPEKLKKAKEEIEAILHDIQVNVQKAKTKASQKVISFSCDVTKWSQVESTFQKVHKLY